MNPIFKKIGFDPDSGIILGRSVLPWQMLYLGTAISLSLLCAYLSWHLYEKHFLKLKAFFPMPKSPLAKPPPLSAVNPYDASDAGRPARENSRPVSNKNQ
jgi:hypothetical protein